MVWHITAWIGALYTFFVHIKNDFMCIVRTFREVHASVAFPAMYAIFLPNRKYWQYCVIISYIVLKPKISCNIVWTLKKISLRGDSHIMAWHKFHPGEGAQVCEIEGNEFSCPTADASINSTCDRERCPLKGPPMAPIMESQITGSAKKDVKSRIEERCIIFKPNTELVLIEFEKPTFF